MGAVSPTWTSNFGVRAFTTTREGGHSNGPFHSLNLSAQIDDDDIAVARNQQRCLAQHGLPHLPRWLRQVHGTRIIDATELKYSFEIEADAVYTNVGNQICGILTADCLPIVLCNDSATEVAAIHAGWRGLWDGIIQSSVRKFSTPAVRLFAWIGPGISRAAYIVGAEFRTRFLDDDLAFESAFRYVNDHWHADLYTIAERRLQNLGVTNVSRYEGCTFDEPERFYSYRRDGVTGRMATLVWFEDRDPRVDHQTI